MAGRKSKNLPSKTKVKGKLKLVIGGKNNKEVFQSWWRFARWFVPVIMLVTFLIYSQHRGGGMGISGAISSGFNDLVVGIFYVIFVITSIVKITLAYRSKK